MTRVVAAVTAATLLLSFARGGRAPVGRPKNADAVTRYVPRTSSATLGGGKR